jgi:hypothetical protein
MHYKDPIKLHLKLRSYLNNLNCIYSFYEFPWIFLSFDSKSHQCILHIALRFAFIYFYGIQFYVAFVEEPDLVHSKY